MASLRLLKNGVEAFPAMFSAIARASASVSAEMYIIADDQTGREFREHLVRAALRGVRVRILVDAVGSWGLADSFWHEFRAAGGEVRWFRPIARGLLSFRNHRKVLLVDDAILYIGGMNIADDYYRGVGDAAPWRDNMLEIAGPEVEWVARSFARMWAGAGWRMRRLFFARHPDRGRALAGGIRFLESGPDQPLRPVRKAYRLLIGEARESIDLAVSYFYPYGGLLRALRRAARKGVRIRMLFPRKTDVTIAQWAAQGLYGRLLKAGIEVWEYVPAMMHAKMIIADRTVVAGSANLDVRSGRINYELVAVVTDWELAARARSDFEEDIKQSVRIELADWKKRTLVQKGLERLSYCLIARLDIFFARLEMPRGRKEEGKKAEG